MLDELLEILCCPEDKGTLTLAVTERADEIVAGTLTCQTCGFVYPIEQGIPNLLPPHLHGDDVHDRINDV